MTALQKRAKRVIQTVSHVCRREPPTVIPANVMLALVSQTPKTAKLAQPIAKLAHMIQQQHDSSVLSAPLTTRKQPAQLATFVL
jgi:hypothetical protein